MKNTDYNGKVIEYRMVTGQVRFAFFIKVLFLLFVVCSLPGFKVKAQAMYTGGKNDPPFVYDETPVRVIVEGYKNFYIYYTIN